MVREQAGQGERWSLCCLAPAHPPGAVTVDALCDGELCGRELCGSYTYLSRRQWAALVGEVAAPSHARNWEAGDATACIPRWST